MTRIERVCARVLCGNIVTVLIRRSLTLENDVLVYWVVCCVVPLSDRAVVVVM